MACTINAAGNSVPTLLVFPRVRYNRNFINGAPVGSIGAAGKSSWMNKYIFITYLKHFVLHSRCSPERKVLLILDNLAAHISLMVVEFYREHGIVLLTIPPKTSHKLQPLNVAVYNLFKTCYGNAIDAWHRSHHGMTMNIYDIPAAVNSA